MRVRGAAVRHEDSGGNGFHVSRWEIEDTQREVKNDATCREGWWKTRGKREKRNMRVRGAAVRHENSGGNGLHVSSWEIEGTQREGEMDFTCRRESEETRRKRIKRILRV